MISEEFIDTYSDDLLYLIDARKTLLTNPLRTEYKEMCDASFCRILAVFTIGSIEAMLETWRSKDKVNILDKYFAKNTENGERIQSLYEAFRSADIKVDKEVFEDYLALKYLRNTIIHARWKENEKKHLQKRGFPTDTRRLTEEHWYRMLEVSQNMMMYIASTDIPGLTERIKKDKLKVTIKKEEFKPIIIRRKDLPDIIRRNLGIIASEIYNSIEKTATSEKYSWNKSLSEEELNKISHEDAKKLFYMTAKKAGLKGYEEISKHKQIANDILYFWRLYKQETFTEYSIGNEELDTSIQIIMKLHSKKTYPNGPFIWDQKLSQQIKSDMIKDCLSYNNYPPQFKQSLINALDVGKSTYEFMNSSFASLFALYLPVIDPELTKTFINEIEFILKAWKLRELWYLFVEKRSQPKMPELLFYEILFYKMINHVNSGTFHEGTIKG